MLVFVRHGRTAYNAEGRLQGQYDSPLDDVGWAQSVAIGHYLREHFDIAHVVTSALARTRQTAEAAGLSELPTTVDNRWREIDFGAYDERKISEVNVNLGAVWLRDPEWIPTGGAESLAGLHRRIGAALDDLLALHREVDHKRAVVVVSHATPIKSAIAHATLGGPAMILRLHIGLGSISTLNVGEETLVLTSFNERPFPASLR